MFKTKKNTELMTANGFLVLDLFDESEIESLIKLYKNSPCKEEIFSGLSYSLISKKYTENEAIEAQINDVIEKKLNTILKIMTQLARRLLTKLQLKILPSLTYIRTGLIPMKVNMKTVLHLGFLCKTQQLKTDACMLYLEVICILKT